MKLFFATLVWFALTACHEQQYTVDYLLEHLDRLEAQLKLCASDAEKSNAQLAKCVVAMKAQDQIKPYLLEQQLDPEKFGQSILSTETACAQLAAQRDSAQETVAKLQTNKVETIELKQAQLNLTRVEMVYAEKSHELKLLMVVAKLNSPD